MSCPEDPLIGGLTSNPPRSRGAGGNTRHAAGVTHGATPVQQRKRSSSALAQHTDALLAHPL